MNSNTVDAGTTEERKQLFTNIWRENHPGLRKFCLRWLCGHIEMTDEVMSMTAEKAFRYIINNHIEIENPFAWLCTMSRNICTDFQRSEIRARYMIEEVEARPEQYYFADKHSLTLESKIEYELELDNLCDEIAKLPQEYQQLLCMRVLDGLAYQEIAELTKLSVVNLRKRIQLVRSELRSHIEH